MSDKRKEDVIPVDGIYLCMMVLSGA